MQQNDWDLQTPYGSTPVRGPARWRWAAAAVGVAILLAAALLVPLPMFYEFRPGPLRDVGPLVRVSDAPTYSSEGKLYLTTVVVRTKVTAAEWFTTLFDDTKEVILRQQLTGEGTLKEALKQAERDMDLSQMHAQEVVFAELGLAGATGDGATVEGTQPDTPAADALRKGDVIVRIDGRPISTSCEVGRAISSREPGEKVSVKLRRAGRVVSLSLETIEDPSAPGAALLGVALSDVNYRFDPAVGVTFETGEIQGPSAGLMMALALYDRLTEDDLTGGRSIAGTGTIECDGGVGPIGSIALKVAGAEARGADVFLAPASEAKAASEAADDIEVLAVSDFADALEALRSLD